MPSILFQRRFQSWLPVRCFSSPGHRAIYILLSTSIIPRLLRKPRQETGLMTKRVTLHGPGSCGIWIWWTINAATKASLPAVPDSLREQNQITYLISRFSFIISTWTSLVGAHALHTWVAVCFLPALFFFLPPGSYASVLPSEGIKAMGPTTPQFLYQYRILKE